MVKGHFILFIYNLISYFSKVLEGVEKETLVWIVLILTILFLLVLIYGLLRFVRKKYPTGLSRLFKRVKLQIVLEKDRVLRPQILTMTIRNVGKNEADIDAPVLEFRKIWTTRKFKLNGINGHHIYPMYIDADKMHQLRIETATFHQYDRSIRSFYWARILVTDIDGRKWKSNKVKLRKSLVT